MASAASDLDPAAEPHAVRESSSAGSGQEEEAPTEAATAAKEVEVVVEEEAAGEEGEEEGECGFCLFMKGGGCKEAFVAWEDCVQSAEKEGSDLVERCFQATANLKKCMDAHNDYYYPVLQAEEAVSDQAEAAIAEADKIKREDSAPSQDTDEKKEDAAESTAAVADEKKEDAAESTAAVADEKKEDAADSTAAVTDEKDTSSPAAGEKKEEAVVEKVGSLSLSN